MEQRLSAEGTVTQMAQKLAASYGNQRYVIVFPTAPPQVDPVVNKRILLSPKLSSILILCLLPLPRLSPVRSPSKIPHVCFNSPMFHLTLGEFVTQTINITVFCDVMPVVFWWEGTNMPQETLCNHLNVFFTIHIVAAGYFEVLVPACIYQYLDDLLTSL
jgi:hypothetical protein